MSAPAAAPQPSLAPLVIDPRERNRLVELASRGYPHEVCGLLVGRRTPSAARVSRVTESPNLERNRAHDRFTLDPDHFVEVDAAARSEGLDVIGIWHTHPDHPARPSSTDLEAAWEGYSYLILSVGRYGVTATRSWQLVDGEFVTQPISEVIS